MPIYEFHEDAILPIEETRFSSSGVRERQDLQRLLREKIEVISPDTLIIAEEFGDWDDSKRRIDLLGVDKAGNLVVIELKRTEDGGHMELQAIRYASMVSKMTFDQAVSTYSGYLHRLGRSDGNPRATLLEFLEWNEPDDDRFAQEVRIVLASAEFSKELTSSVLWLIEHDIDIRCIRLKPYAFDSRLLVDVQQIIPLPEAAEYQIQVREKARKEREARSGGADFTRFDVRMKGELHPAMWKRNAIFLVCSRLCRDGINPDDLADLFDWRSNRVWYSVEGDVNSESFHQLAAEKAKRGGSAFDSRRWFLADDELIRWNDKTYAFSNQWGGESWRKAMKALQREFPDYEIDYSPCT